MEYILLYIIVGLLFALPVAKVTKQNGIDLPVFSYVWLVFTWPAPLLIGAYKGVRDSGIKGANAPTNAGAKRPSFAQAVPDKGGRNDNFQIKNRPAPPAPMHPLPKINPTMPDVGTLTPAQEVMLNGLQIELHRAMIAFCRECHDKGQPVTPAAMQDFLRQWIDDHLQPPRPRVNVNHDGRGGISVDVDYCAEDESPSVTREYKGVL